MSPTRISQLGIAAVDERVGGRLHAMPKIGERSHQDGGENHGGDLVLDFAS